MHPVLRTAVLGLCVLLMFAGICMAKQVYLKDGAAVECQSFWQQGDQVVVKVNRDILLDFDRGEVDLKKTFGARKKTVHHVRRKLQAKEAGLSASAPKEAAQAAPVTAPPPAPAPAPPNLKQAAAPAPVAAPTPPPAAPTPAAKEVAQATAPQPDQAEPAAPSDKAEQERKMKEAADMMAEAIQKQDPELLKKALEAQKNAVPPEQQAKRAGRSLKVLLIMLFFSLLIVVSMWVVFEKAGQTGFYSIIPIFNLYTLMEISGKPWWWMFLLFIPVVGFIVYLLAMLSLAERFGRGALYGIGLFILPMFFFPMLAFGGAQYEG